MRLHWLTDRTSVMANTAMKHLDAYTTWAFVGGGIIIAVGVWLLYLWLLFIISIIASEY